MKPLKILEHSSSHPRTPQDWPNLLKPRAEQAPFFSFAVGSTRIDCYTHSRVEPLIYRSPPPCLASSRPNQFACSLAPLSPTTNHQISFVLSHPRHRFDKHSGFSPQQHHSCNCSAGWDKQQQLCTTSPSPAALGTTACCDCSILRFPFLQSTSSPHTSHLISSPATSYKASELFRLAHRTLLALHLLLPSLLNGICNRGCPIVGPWSFQTLSGRHAELKPEPPSLEHHIIPFTLSWTLCGGSLQTSAASTHRT